MWAHGRLRRLLEPRIYAACIRFDSLALFKRRLREHGLRDMAETEETGLTILRERDVTKEPRRARLPRADATDPSGSNDPARARTRGHTRDQLEGRATIVGTPSESRAMLTGAPALQAAFTVPSSFGSEPASSTW